MGVMGISAEQEVAILADLDGIHGHLEPEPEPACSAGLVDLFPVQRAYRWEHAGEA